MSLLEVGIDEAGRGPLAGPVAVGVVVVPLDFDWDFIPNIRDSKLLNPDKRYQVYEHARERQKKGLLRFAVSMVGPKQIDRIGITAAVSLGIQRSIQRLQLDPGDCVVKLDGLLKAPKEFLDQKTIVRGDQTEKSIGLASIMAKVTRDAYMVRQSTRSDFAAYGFETHKGYATKSHREAIHLHGLCTLHRASYCRNLLML